MIRTGPKPLWNGSQEMYDRGCDQRRKGHGIAGKGQGERLFRNFCWIMICSSECRQNPISICPASRWVDAIIRNVSKDVPVLVHSVNVQRAPVMVSKLESERIEVEGDRESPWIGLQQERVSRNGFKTLEEVWEDLNEE